MLAEVRGDTRRGTGESGGAADSVAAVRVGPADFGPCVEASVRRLREIRASRLPV